MTGKDIKGRTASEPGARAARRRGGFVRPAALIEPHLRRAGEKRGFAVARLLTHWSEHVGPEIAAMTRPVKVGYGRRGFGATLTLLVRGADAPVVEAERERIRERVNAAYGYNAVARIHITQIAPEAGMPPGMAEAPAPWAPPQPAPAVAEQARALSAAVHDDDLRQALEALARNVLSRNNPTERKGK